MFQENVTGVVIRALDYKDSDKLLRIFTLESGIVSAVIKGVKKQTAKLKFASQLFAFCQFSLAKNPKTGYLTVTGAVSIEDMFDLTTDIDKFLPACVCLEAVDSAVKDDADTEVFILFLKTLKAILYSESLNPKTSACFFLAKLLGRGGYISFENANIKSLTSKLSTAQEPKDIQEFNEAAQKAFVDVAKIFERCFVTKLNSLKMLA